MNIKFTRHSWLRAATVTLAALMATPLLLAASITHDGINYTTSGQKATVVKYTIVKATADTPADTLFYKGDIVIPETFEHEGTTYTVVATGANAFLDCKELTSVVLPETCVTIARNTFKGCSALTNDPIPATVTSVGNGVFNGCLSLEQATVRASWGKIISEQFSECPLKKLTVAGTEPVVMNIEAFGKTSAAQAAIRTLEEIVLECNVDASAYANNQQPFHNLAGLKTVTIGANVTSIASTMFQGCTALTDVTFAEGNQVATIGSSAFAGCTSLPTIAIPEAVTAIEQSTFNGCRALSSVTMGNNVTSIGITAFYNTALSTIALPEALTTIGQSAFQKAPLTGELVIPAGVTAIGTQAFAETQLTGISIPASVTSIGSAAFAPIPTLANLTLADDNTSFALSNGILTTADGKRLLVTDHQNPDALTAINNDMIETIDNYGLAYSPMKTVELGVLKQIGNYAFYNSKVESFLLRSTVTVGQNVFNGAALKEITIAEGRNEIPMGLCANCPELATVNLPSSTTNIMRDAFGNCPKLETMELPANVNYMESGAVPATIKNLRVLNPNPSALAAGVFTASQSEVECKVAQASVDKFKAASQWQYLNIVGDATIEAGNAALGCPTGLYFATTDGKLMYKDENGQVVDTKFNAGEHAFTLQSYKNRIYVAVAGHNFTYQDPAQPLGDGELFYVNNTNGIFYRVGVLNNVGYAPSEDPFTMFIHEATNKIYISDRNVGIHEMDADTTGLYGSQPFLLQNQWLPYYNDQISWGSITGGFTIDNNGIFWMSKKFNGLGLLRFTRADIYPDGGQGKTQHFKVLFKDDIIKTIYLDEANGYLYMNLLRDHNNACVPGIYRIALSKLQNADGSDKEGNDLLSMADCELIDDSPIAREVNSSFESSGEVPNIAQITSDGENIYWGYIAPTDDADAITGSVPLDTSNPLHHSGIKCIKADAETPVVQFAVENVKAYGIAGATYVPDEEPRINGDVDGNGSVGVEDVNAVINVMLGKTQNPLADLSGNGSVGVEDVNAVINIMLGK
ncbi:MAG: leucine-rich repeat protein [Muribaculaceae bacterium]|nr:leucine-rich repeat protein [Muribaculaceae bacterium]